MRVELCCPAEFPSQDKRVVDAKAQEEEDEVVDEDVVELVGVCDMGGLGLSFAQSRLCQRPLSRSHSHAAEPIAQA